MSFSHAIPFTAQQLLSLAAWGEAQLGGFAVRIATNHEELDEVAELFRSGQSCPAYRIAAISTGEVDVMDENGAVDVAAGLGAALAWIEQQELALPAV